MLPGTVPEPLHSLQAEHSRELPKIKGSRFLAFAFPVPEPAAMRSALERLRRQHPHANHHCSAWRLGPGEERSDDDGEPAGSAGRPMLQQLETRFLVRSGVVVVRYFGGTKLGVGGLIRAYGQAAAAVLEETPKEAWVETRSLLLRYPYSCSGAVDGVLHAEGLAKGEQRFDADVHLELEVPVERWAALRSLLEDGTAGQVRFPEEGAAP